jgi:hypothetical protein
MKLGSKAGLGALALALSLCCGAASADETPFAALYTTDILPKGGKEVEQWLTWEHGRPAESWNRVEGRTEFEYGVTGDFQISGYLNYDYFRIRPQDPAGQNVDRLDFTSGSIEAIYRLTDPYTHPIGVAFYLEPAYGADMREIEGKILLDSHFFDDRLIFALNGILDYEWQRPAAGAPLDHATELTVLAGASYRFAPGLFASLEFEAKREGDGLIFGDAFHPAAQSYRVGPTLHYARDDWWMTLGWLSQLPVAARLNSAPDEVVDGFAHEVPRHSLRLRVGVEF